MDYPICNNPNCKSHGRSHPNCRCTPVEGYAEGGSIGGIDFTPDPAPAPDSHTGIDFQPDDQEAAKQAKYGTLPQQAFSAVEGVGKGLAGPLSTLAETKLGVPPEDIQGREEANPITHVASEAAGLVGGSLLSGGLGEFSQAGALKAVGEAAAEKLGLSGVKSVAVKMGVENALFTLGDELSKSIKNNPDSIQTAAIHVGLSGILGAGVGVPLGAASKFWVEKIAPKAEPFVKDFTDSFKANAADSSEFVPTPDEPIKNFVRPGAPLFPEEPLSSPSKGGKAAQKMIDYLSNVASEAIADSAGAALGHSTGIPGAGTLGAYIGHRSLKPLVRTILPSIVKGFLNNEASAIGLKAAFEGVEAISKGESLMNTAAQGLFQTGSTAVLNSLVPDKESLHGLDLKVEELSQNPEGMFELGGSMGHYMPEHQSALAATSQNAINYLMSRKPRVQQPGVLNRPIAPTQADMAAYYRTLGIAQQPLSIINHINKGTLQPKDVQDLKALYPYLYPNITQKIQHYMMNHISNGKPVSFKLRKGLTLLTGQPMDSTFSQPAMLAAQATFAPINPPGGPTTGSPKKGTSKVGKVAQMTATPQERRQEALLKA